MAKVPQLQTLISLFLLLLALANIHMALSQTTSFVHRAPSRTDLTFQGDASVPSGSSAYRLTRTNNAGNPQTGSVGRILHSRPIKFWGPGQQIEFETNIGFRIKPIDNNPADGIVFFIAPSGTTIPRDSGGGNFGVFSASSSSNAVFAVEFDTFINTWDPRFRHVGIDINSATSVRVGQLNGTFLGTDVRLRIRYDASISTINVVVFLGSTGRLVASHAVDLSKVLRQTVQVGIASSTGRYVALHEVYYWDFTATMRNHRSVAGDGDGAGIYHVGST